MIVTQNGNEVPCKKKNLAGDKQKQENFINSEENKIKFDDPKFKTITSRENFLKVLIESGRNLSADDDFYVRFMYATCLRHHEPIYNHDIQHFKTIKNVVLDQINIVLAHKSLHNFFTEYITYSSIIITPFIFNNVKLTLIVMICRCWI